MIIPRVRRGLARFVCGVGGGDKTGLGLAFEQGGEMLLWKLLGVSCSLLGTHRVL